jgi:hypothetical protein
MSAQLRYRTLARNIGQIYASPKEGRTNLLQSGLDEIVTVINPNSTSAWNVVGADSERLLKVWVAKEADPAADEVANQLTDLLWELSMEDKVAPAPALELKEIPSLAAVAALSDQIKHINLSGDDDDDEVEVEVEETASHQSSEMEVEVEEEEEDAPPPPPVKAAAAKPVEVAAKPAAKPVEAAPKPVEVAAKSAPAVAPKPVEAAPKPVAKAPVAEPEPESEEEVVEPEEEDEEESDYDYIHIRGRPYWLDRETQKIHAAVGADEELGDEVGEMVEGKPKFYAK